MYSIRQQVMASSGLRNVQSVQMHRGPPTSGGPPFDRSHAEKFDYEKLYQIMIKSLCICFKCHYICTPSLKMHLFQVLLHISPFPRQYYF